MADQIGNGTILGHSTTLGGTYTAIPRVFNIDVPGQAYGEEDITAIDSTIIEKIKTLRDPEKLTWECRYNETEFMVQVGLIGTGLYWKVTFPDGTYGIAQGYVESIGELKVTSTGALNFKTTVKLTSLFAYTTA